MQVHSQLSPVLRAVSCIYFWLKKPLNAGRSGFECRSLQLVHQLTPRLWKQSFASNPLRSDLHKFGATGNIDVE
jgi:hypothetical protein